MNIWFFNHYAVPPWFYPLARPYNFAKYLIKKGHKVTIFAASTVHNSDKNLIENNELYKVEIIDEIRYVYIKTSNYKSNGLDRIKNMLEYTVRLISVTKHFEKPIVIIATSVHPLACVAGIKITKKYGCKCIVEIADMWPLTLIEIGKLKENSLIAKLLYKLENWIYKKADSIIFTMEGGKEYISEKNWNNDIDTSKIYYINNGIDLEVFNQQQNEVYEDYDLNNKNTYKVLYTGSIVQSNVVDILVKAGEEILRSKKDNIKIIIFGDGPEKQNLEKYCNENRIDNVIFKGSVDKKYIPSILQKGDLNVMTGKASFNLYKYGLSLNKMFDYMASGRPILSNIECGYDILQKYMCGITVNSISSEELAKGILQFYNMPKSEYKEYCENAQKLSKSFDFKILTDKLEQVIKNTLEENHEYSTDKFKKTI